MASPNTEQRRAEEFREAVRLHSRHIDRPARPRDRSLRGKARRIAARAARTAARLTQENR